MGKMLRSEVKAILVLAVLTGLAGTGGAGEPAKTKKSSSSDPDRWEASIQKFEAQDRKSPPAKGGIVFVGSSTMVGWNLQKSFPDSGAVNRGFGGSQMADSLRYADRIVIPLALRVVVVYAGDNDLASGKTPKRVAEDFRQFVAKIHATLPETRIVYLGIKPSVARRKLIDKGREANRLIREFAASNPRLVFVDVEKTMLGPDGQPRAELLKSDGLHLNEEGYRLWSELVRPHLTAGK